MKHAYSAYEIHQKNVYLFDNFCNIMYLHIKNYLNLLFFKYDVFLINYFDRMSSIEVASTSKKIFAYKYF